MGIDLQSINLCNHDKRLVSEIHIRYEMVPTVSDGAPEQFYVKLTVSLGRQWQHVGPSSFRTIPLLRWQVYYAGNDSRLDPPAPEQFHCCINSLTRWAVPTGSLHNNSTTVEPTAAGIAHAITTHQKEKNKSWCISNEFGIQLRGGSIRRLRYVPKVLIGNQLINWSWK